MGWAGLGWVGSGWVRLGLSCSPTTHTQLTTVTTLHQRELLAKVRIVVSLDVRFFIGTRYMCCTAVIEIFVLSWTVWAWRSFVLFRRHPQRVLCTRAGATYVSVLETLTPGICWNLAPQQYTGRSFTIIHAYEIAIYWSHLQPLGLFFFGGSGGRAGHGDSATRGWKGSPRFFRRRRVH